MAQGSNTGRNRNMGVVYSPKKKAQQVSNSPRILIRPVFFLAHLSASTIKILGRRKIKNK
jgi:hypothetical protein